MILYHAGYLEIPAPDVHYGRRNADFGQGFYLTADRAFAEKWAKERKGEQIFVNRYDLNTEGLAIKRFTRDEAWFDYLFANRAGAQDSLAAYDVVMGPIANDTIFDTCGIITSGLLKKEEALPLLLAGPEYEQIVLKTEKAASHLRWLGARRLNSGETALFQQELKRMEEVYQRQISEIMAQNDAD